MACKEGAWTIGPIAVATWALWAGGLALLVGATIAVAPRKAAALPSFARQPGQPGGACHTDFPQLTPFGRRFKLSGYTLGGGDNKSLGQPGWVPPVSAQTIFSFTHTQAPTDNAGSISSLRPNDNVEFQ